MSKPTDHITKKLGNKLGMVIYDCNNSTPEVETEKPEGQDHLQLGMEFEARLGHENLSLNK